MRPAIWLLAPLAALCAWMLAPGHAAAEGFIDLYLGTSFTKDSEVDFNVLGAPTPGAAAFDDSAIGGLRGGYWIDRLPWLGIAADVSFFKSDATVQVDPLVFGSPSLKPDVYVVPISALLMMRTPLLRTETILDRFQPFAAVGPGLFVSVVDVKNGPDRFAGASVDVGLDVRGGLNVFLQDWLTLFTEYRHTRLNAKWDDNLTGLDASARTSLRTHYVLGGVGFHFPSPTHASGRR